MEKEQIYQTILNQLESLLENEHDLIANMANAASILYHNLHNVNWAGFYLYKENELVLGPFQGKVACMHIPIGKGVCGTSALTKSIVRVDDVHQFPGHIACDSASNSEIVIPIIKKNTLIGVLDIDSNIFSCFNSIDEYYLQSFVDILINHMK